MTGYIPNRRFSIFALALAGLLVCLSIPTRAASTGLETPTVTSGLRLVRDIGQFEVGVPVGWSRYKPDFGLSPEEKGVFELVMLGPPSVEGIRSEIKVSYYAHGNLICKTSEKFLRLHAQPVFGTVSSGGKYRTVKEELIGGRTAWLFERDRVEYLPPRTLNPKKIPVYEQYVMISAKNGFFVLRSYAGVTRKAMVQELFEVVLSSFKPLVD